MSNGGEVGSRGYIFQSIVALMDCLGRCDWDEIKVEPNTDQDKVDIQLYSNGEILSAIQVKSSVNAFKKSDAQKYLDAARNDAPDAKEVYLYLITDKYTESIKQYANNEPDVKECPFEHLEDACKGKLLDYVDRAGFSENITASNLILIYKTLFATVILNSKATRPISRAEFEAELQRAISVSKVDKVPPEIAKCLTPIPAINQSAGLIGRDDIVNNVIELLKKNNGTALVNGLGGIGKTAVMLYVCNKLKDDGNYVAWFKWESSLKDGLLLLRDALRIPTSEKADEAYALVISTIRDRLAGKLYLFIDDLTRKLSDDEMSLLNSLQIHVMVTSRFEYEYFKNIPLDVLAKDAAIDMFFEYYKRKRNTKDEVTVWNIIDFVHSHTLLVELLAKAAREEGGTLEKFYMELQKKGFFEVSDEEVLSEHDKKYLTIEQSIIKLYGISNLSKAEQHIMRLFIIFTPERPIYSKVRDWAGLDRKAMRNLVERGWLDRGREGYIIHQIVRDSLSKQVGEVKIEDYGNLLYNLIDTDNYLSVTETYEVIRERIVLTEDIARYLWDKYQADGEKSELWAFDAGRLINNLANVYKDQGAYEKALKYYEKALAIFERVLGTEHPDTAMMYNNMANVYYDQGDYEKALGYHGKALAIRELVLGTEHLDTAGTYNNMAVVYSNQGAYEKALEYFSKALAICELALGTEHSETAMMYGPMANVYYGQGAFEKALAYYRKALVIFEQVLGTEHPDTTLIYNNIATVYNAQGNYEKSLEYHGKALAIRERVLGIEHPNTATTYNNMATVYYVQGAYEKALEYYSKALAIRERILGTEHPETARTHGNMATVYDAQGYYENALEYYSKALAIFERVLGTEHMDTAKTYNNMATVYDVKGNYEKALEYLGKALAIFERILGTEHPDTAGTYYNMAIVYKAQGDYEKALEYYHRALKVYLTIFGEEYPLTKRIRKNLTDLQEQKN